jgi:hypothetical protein
MSDPALHICPSCGQDSFSKQLTAAGFQLKGSGWYATDFKGGGSPPAAPATDKTDASPAAPAAGADTPVAATSAAACAPSCACH